MIKNKVIICKVIWGNIRKFQYVQGMSMPQLAKILGVSERSIYNYDANPGNLPLGRVQLFIEATGVTMESLIQ